jgi:hypothetical protein
MVKTLVPALRNFHVAKNLASALKHLVVFAVTARKEHQ